MLTIDGRCDENQALGDVGCHDGRMAKPITAGGDSASQGEMTPLFFMIDNCSGILIMVEGV